MGVVSVFVFFLLAPLADDAAIAAENLALGQQLGVLQRSVKRPVCAIATGSSWSGCPRTGRMTRSDPVARRPMRRRALLCASVEQLGGSRDVGAGFAGHAPLATALRPTSDAPRPDDIFGMRSRCRPVHDAADGMLVSSALSRPSTFSTANRQKTASPYFVSTVSTGVTCHPPGSWHSTELRPQPYLLQLSRVTPRGQVLLDPVGYALSPFGCRYLRANREKTASKLLPPEPW
jgi:hypothetical protein